MADVDGYAFKQTGHFDVSRRPDRSIFSAVHNPPASVVAAEAASREARVERGEDVPPSIDYSILAYENRDFIKEAHDKTTIVHDAE